jgi:CcmD family protein
MKNFWSIFAAYLAAWAIFFAYHLSVGRRIARLQEQIDRLKQMLGGG